MDNAISKTYFEAILSQHYNGAKRTLWTNQTINEVIKLLESFNTFPKGTQLYIKCYNYLRRYQVSTIILNNKIKKRIVYKNSPNICVVPKEKFYRILSNIHIDTNHGGRTKMLKYVNKYYYIPRPAIEMLIKSCVRCTKRRQKFYNGKYNLSSSFYDSDWVSIEKLKNEYNNMLISHYKNKYGNLPWSQENLTLLINKLQYSSQLDNIKDKFRVLKDLNGFNYVSWNFSDEISPKILSLEQCFDKLHEVHLETNHGNLNEMKEFISNKYHIPTIAMQIYLECCKTCKGSIQNFDFLLKRKIVDFTGIFQFVDISNENNENLLLIYHYDETDFLQLRLLQSSKAKTVASNLFDIFKEHGIPTNLQYAGNSKFFKKVVESLETQLLDCKLKPDYDVQYQLGNLEKYKFLYAKINILMSIWQSKNRNIGLSLGCNIVQSRLNAPRIDITTNKSARLDKSGDKSDNDDEDAIMSDLNNTKDETINSDDDKITFDYDYLLETSDEETSL